ncbi:acetate--CoA ligase family protein [Rhodovarius sp.]|uniref:acetate--CoA ligase family protein n=1 Tax=Rhodovarius sp. TaxID=2972673 RepID=UPI0034A4E700
MSLFSALFNPGSVALIGASADPGKDNSRAQRLLQREGFSGRIIPVNPGRAEIMGVPAFADIRAVPGPVDHAFIMVAARDVPAAIAGCVEKGVAVATIFSAGFAEADAAGRARQDEMVATARAGGLRLLGPNCLGVVSVASRVPLTLNAAIEAEPLLAGRLALVSQSGSMMGALFSRAAARGIGFSRMVSVGNECDIGVGELAELLVEDDATGAVLLFLETFRDAPRLAAAARRAHALGKPIIAYKLGRSEVGRTIALSHTGAMLGGDELAQAFFRAHGILRVETLEGLLETARLVMGHKPPRGRGFSAMTATGGGAAMVVDRLGLHGHALVGPDAGLRERLGEGGIRIPDAPLIDLPMGASGPAPYSTTLRGMDAADTADALLAVLGSSARNQPERALSHITPALPAGRPLAVFAAPQADAALALFEAAGIAAFRTPESCADALHAYLSWREPAALKGGALPPALPEAQRLNEHEACAFFGELGITPPGARVLRSPADAAGMAGPLALKILSPDILHKTDAGLVRLGVATADIAATVADLLARAAQAFPAARLDGVLAAPMHKGLAEVILGYRRDAEVGPVVVLGMGGVLAELTRRITARIAPVSLEEAMGMIADLPELRLLQGFRGLPRGDVAALAAAIQALSTLAASDVAEAEINPLIIKPEGQGVVALDGLLLRMGD